MSDGPYSYVYNCIQAYSFKGDMGLEKFVQWSTVTGFWLHPKNVKKPSPATSWPWYHFTEQGKIEHVH